MANGTQNTEWAIMTLPTPSFRPDQAEEREQAHGVTISGTINGELTQHSRL